MTPCCQFLPLLSDKEIARKQETFVQQQENNCSFWGRCCCLHLYPEALSGMRQRFHEILNPPSITQTYGFAAIVSKYLNIMDFKMVVIENIHVMMLTMWASAFVCLSKWNWISKTQMSLPFSIAWDKEVLFPENSWPWPRQVFPAFLFSMICGVTVAKEPLLICGLRIWNFECPHCENSLSCFSNFLWLLFPPVVWRN